MRIEACAPVPMSHVSVRASVVNVSPIIARGERGPAVFFLPMLREPMTVR